MKTCQYISNILLSYNFVKDPSNRKKLKSSSFHFSNTRKIIKLAHFLQPLSVSLKLVHTKDTNILPQMAAIVGTVNDLSDDIVCLSKIGLLNSKYSTKYAPISDRLWFLSILLDLYSEIIKLDNSQNN